MGILTYYIFIALILSLTVMISDSGEDKVDRIIEEKRDGIAIAILIAIWPFTLVLTMFIYIKELYKTYITKKIEKLLHRAPITPLEVAIKNYSIPELKLLLKAHNLGVLHINANLKNSIEKLITDKSFEEHFLSKEDKC